jgi:2-amino-4-hydroxy-6-hydroxymethyldihydropteridine diphosphokinase
MNRAILSLGSNMGDRHHHLERAIRELDKHNCRILKHSSVYETAAWGNEKQGNYYNEVLEIETKLSAQQLMQLILQIEQSMGRVRKEKWEPRIIDIDILFFNDEIIHSANLSIPHPHLQERRFVLIPLNEILPELIHPILKKTISVLLNELNDSLEVKKIST